jgi:translation initiation factor 1
MTMRLFEGTPFDRPPRCGRCERLESECDCPPEEPEVQHRPPEKQRPKIYVEKRKRGKIVTVVAGLDDIGNHLSDLLTELKNRCGAGGTVEDQKIIIQGEHCERLAELLRRKGYRVGNR